MKIGLRYIPVGGSGRGEDAARRHAGIDGNSAGATRGGLTPWYSNSLLSSEPTVSQVQEQKGVGGNKK